MTQAFKLFCFAISVLLFLQFADADPKKSPSKDDTEPNGQGEEHKAAFLKTVDKIVDSKAGTMVRQASSVAKEQIKQFTKNFQDTLNAESKNQVNDKNRPILNGIKSHIFLPAEALVKTGFNTLKEPVGDLISNAKTTYAEKLAQSKTNKPIAALKASTNIVGSAISNIFGRASSMWGFGKKDKAPAEKSEKED